MEPADQGKIQQIVPEHEKTYPEPQKFGIIPSYGFFIRHAKNIEMNNVMVKYLENETRPAMILIDVKGIEMRNVDLMKSESSPLISVESVTGFSLKDCKNLKDVSLQEVVKQSF